MNKIRHLAVGLLIFSVVIGLFLTSYNDLNDSYGWTEGDLQSVNVSGTVESSNIAEQFDRMIIVSSMNLISSSILSMTNPTASFSDIAGAIFSSALGILGTIAGLITFPTEIGFIIASFYAGQIPGLITGTLIAGVTIYIAFILLSARLRHDV